MNPTMNTSAAMTPVSSGLSSRCLAERHPERDRHRLKEKARVAAEEFGHNTCMWLAKVIMCAPRRGLGLDVSMTPDLD